MQDIICNMKRFYNSNNKIDWLNTAFYIICAPFRFVSWLIKKTLKYLKIVIFDIFKGLYNKFIAIIVSIIVIIAISYFVSIFSK